MTTKNLFPSVRNMVILQHTWPFPSKDNPLTPWTPEQQRQYAEEQLKRLPDAPM